MGLILLQGDGALWGARSGDAGLFEIDVPRGPAGTFWDPDSAAAEVVRTRPRASEEVGTLVLHLPTRLAPAEVAPTGVPTAMASRTGKPKPSESDG